jgi:hypothetical protein
MTRRIQRRRQFVHAKPSLARIMSVEDEIELEIEFKCTCTAA